MHDPRAEPKPDILLFHELPKGCEQELERSYRVHRIYAESDPQRSLKEVGRLAKGCVSWRLDAAMLDEMPNLEIACKFGVGLNHIDLNEARRRKVRVTNTPNVVNDAVAELAIGMMIALSRRLIPADRHIRDGKWPAGSFPPQRQLVGKTAGILGLGRLGKEIAARCQAMRMRVIYCGRNEQFDTPFLYYKDPVEMAREADWLIVAVPSTPDTTKLVSRRVLEALGAEGHVVNISRGACIDEAAMIEMLSEGKLAGAALDVFTNEPDVPEALRKLDNVVLSPHQGVYTDETLASMGRLLIANLEAHFSGRPLPTVPVT
jgi:lactate dehydrogenase-like 2-hydroxyacid dehydrogenase